MIEPPDSLRTAFFDALPAANEADWMALSGPIAAILKSGASAATLEGHLVVDGNLLEVDARALVAKLQERGILA